MRSLAKNIFSVVCSLLFPSHSLSFYRFNIIFGGKSTMCALMGENVRARRTFWQRTVHNNEKLCVLCKESTPIGEKIKERSDERKKSERREERCRKIKFFDGMTRSYVNESHSWKKQQQQQQPLSLTLWSVDGLGMLSQAKLVICSFRTCLCGAQWCQR